MVVLGCCGKPIILTVSSVSPLAGSAGQIPRILVRSFVIVRIGIMCLPADQVQAQVLDSGFGLWCDAIDTGHLLIKKEFRSSQTKCQERYQKSAPCLPFQSTKAMKCLNNIKWAALPYK